VHASGGNRAVFRACKSLAAEQILHHLRWTCTGELGTITCVIPIKTKQEYPESVTFSESPPLPAVLRDNSTRRSVQRNEASQACYDPLDCADFLVGHATPLLPASSDAHSRMSNRRALSRLSRPRMG
jgi:hypothetical protein